MIFIIKREGIKNKQSKLDCMKNWYRINKDIKMSVPLILVQFKQKNNGD